MTAAGARPFDRADVLVVGAGLAGLRTATRLAHRGRDVLLVERRPRLTGPIRTTGIFVRRALLDFEVPAGCLAPPIRRVVLYPPGLRRPVTLVSAYDEFRVADMAALYAAEACAAVASGVRLALGTRYAGRATDGFTVIGADGPATVAARFVVGADGARSHVARDLSLDRNRHLLIGAEEVFSIPPGPDPPVFHCVLDPSYAPGYLAWVVNDGRRAHVGVAGYPNRFPSGMCDARPQPLHDGGAGLVRRHSTCCRRRATWRSDPGGRHASPDQLPGRPARR